MAQAAKHQLSVATMFRQHHVAQTAHDSSNGANMEGANNDNSNQQDNNNNNNGNGNQVTAMETSDDSTNGDTANLGDSAAGDQDGDRSSINRDGGQEEPIDDDEEVDDAAQEQSKLYWHPRTKEWLDTICDKLKSSKSSEVLRGGMRISPQSDPMHYFKAKLLLTTDRVHPQLLDRRDF